MAGAPWVTSAGTGKVGWALQQDYADAAAAVLSGSGHENTIYELSGKPMTQEELVATLGSVLGKEVLVQQVDDSVYAEIMKGSGVPDFVIPVLVEIQKAIRYGQLDIDSDDFGGLLGRPATSIEVALSQIVRELSH
jgi:NAD(P)H dehydrogenase (quinone)